MKPGNVISVLTPVCFSIGGASALAVLARHAALFDRRLCIQWHVHPEEYGPYSQLLRNSSQRGEVSRLVRTFPTSAVVSEALTRR